MTAGIHLMVRWGFPGDATTPLVGTQIVGRDPACDAVLDGNEISRRHAELRVEGPAVLARDLGSRNGLFVNGVRCAQAALACGDVVRCGEWIGVIAAETIACRFSEIAPGWYGGSALQAAVETARKAAASDLPIVVQGETGTGKEGMAKAIHAWSGRPGPFVAVNCAAIPAHLAEAELFGHRKGAFTGADKASAGLVRAASGGTLFLDEVLELDASVQPKLLRCLERREVLALGESRPVAVDLRVLAASQEPLYEAVARKAFRADLQARLDGVTVVLPPLRLRREDVAPLFVRFVRDATGGRPPSIEAKLVEALCLYDWPLNVRELVLLTRSLLQLHGSEPVLRRDHLPQRVVARPAARPAPVTAAPRAEDRPVEPRAELIAKRGWRRTDDRAEFEALVEALRAHDGSVGRAATALGISRPRAYRLLAAQEDFALEELRKPR